MTLQPGDPCPCDSGSAFGDCCQPIISARRPADTAEALMRSRYSAFVLMDLAHLRRSWHPDTLPADLQPDPDSRWLGLKIKASEAGGADDDHGTVEFVARFKRQGRGHRLHENSRFTRFNGLWVYVDGELIEKPARRHR